MGLREQNPKHAGQIEAIVRMTVERVSRGAKGLCAPHPKLDRFVNIVATK